METVDYYLQVAKAAAKASTTAWAKADAALRSARMIDGAAERAWVAWETAKNEIREAKLKDLRKGTYISWHAHTSKPHLGMSYKAGSGMLLDDAGMSEGWDVVDVSYPGSNNASIYCFSIERES